MTVSSNALGDIQLLIFDLDGTLVDSQMDLALSVNAVREQEGLGPLPHDLIASYVGHGVNVLIRRAIGDQATDKDVQRVLTSFLDYYRRHLLDHTVTYPGVHEALEELRVHKLAVLTNKPVKYSRAILAGLGIDHHFAFVYGGDSFGQKKPDPIGVTTLLNDFEVSPEQTLIVGDSDTDVLTGRAAGVWTCGVIYGFGAPSLESAPPDLVLGDLRDLPLLLNDNSKRGPGPNSGC